MAAKSKLFVTAGTHLEHSWSGFPGGLIKNRLLFGGVFLFSIIMKSKIIIGTSLLTAVLLVVIHNAALNSSWYYLYPHIDIPIHLLGGFSVGLLMYTVLISWLPFGYEEGSSDRSRLRSFYIITFGTFLTTIVWEILELVFYLTNDAGLSWETLSDIFFGVIGAMLAWGFIQLLSQSKTPPKGEVK